MKGTSFLEASGIVIGRLSPGDSSAFSDFITELYLEYPMAMNFTKEPERGELDDLLGGKIKGMQAGIVVDLVARRSGEIVGECEIVKRWEGNAVVGIIVRKDYRAKGVGAELLERSLQLARTIGIRELTAEVDSANVQAISFFRRMGFSDEGPAQGRLRFARSISENAA
ncbi:MAG: GNAT family N-acetyltransferase [Candidatus Micrarchaeota archaeon]|nr:GNAT family N-acetyltransferase [Candidatus Micrarchaeota archaeon]